LIFSLIKYLSIKIQEIINIEMLFEYDVVN
jgi:hypothetical protein